MDDKLNIGGFSRRTPSFDNILDAQPAQTKKAKITPATKQSTASTSDERKASKPSPAIFAEAGKKLSLPPPKPGWSAKNPVVVIKSQAEFTKAAQTMLAQIEKNNPNDTTLQELNELKLKLPLAKNIARIIELGNGGNEALKKLQSLKSHDEYMNQPVDDKSLTHKFNLPITALSATKMVERLAKNDETEEDEDQEGLVYNIDGNPVGLARCFFWDEDRDSEKGGEYYIDTLVADPWVRGAGTTLIEAAVNRSEEHGLHGKVLLTPLNDEVKKQYESLGFEPINDNRELLLDPEASVMWSKDSDGHYYCSDKAKDPKKNDHTKPSYFTSLEALKS